MRVANGYFYFKVGERCQLTEHFNTQEFECRKLRWIDGINEPEQRVSIELVGCLEAIRRRYGKPIHITSGFRTAAYQQYLRDKGYKTSKGISTHELGDAVDIDCDNWELRELAADYFNAIGLGETFVHVDIRRDKERSWSYGNK